MDLTQAIFRDQSVLLTVQKCGKHSMILNEFFLCEMTKKHSEQHWKATSPGTTGWNSSLCSVFISVSIMSCDIQTSCNVCKISFYVYGWVFCLCASRRGLSDLIELQFQRLWAAVWVLGIQCRTSGGAASSVKAEPSLQPQTQVLSELQNLLGQRVGWSVQGH